MATQQSLEAYEERKAEIKTLLRKIEAGLEKHDRECSTSRIGHCWAAVGDLDHYKSELQDLSDSLHHEGEYAE